MSTMAGESCRCQLYSIRNGKPEAVGSANTNATVTVSSGGDLEIAKAISRSARRRAARAH